MQKYTYIYWIHTDAMNNRRNDKDARKKTSLTKYLPLTLFVSVGKGCVGFYCERELETEHNWNIWPQSYGFQRCVFLVLQGCSTGGPEATLMGDGFLYGILSASSPDLNSSGPQAPSAWCGFPYHTSLQLAATPLARWSQLSYIIVRRPLDLWNRMFNRHQAEITVMQFRGHSLPVHHSVVAQWDLHIVPYYQP